MSNGRSPSEDGADGLSGDNDPRNQSSGGARQPTQAELDEEIARNKAENKTGEQVSHTDPLSQAG